MNHKNYITVTKDLFKNSEIDEEWVCRTVAKKLIGDLPINDLKKLINFTKIDPESEEWSINGDIWHCLSDRDRRRIIELRQKECIVYEGSIEI